MREILFRGKRIDNGEWVYGNYIEKNDPTKESPIFWASLIHDKALSAIEVIPETIGQFIGLTDKNGTKIFEGDIITHKFGVKKAVVYNQHHACFKARFETGGGFVDNLTYYIERDCEVIGNIHDKQ